jgi:hypothetical protein
VDPFETLIADMDQAGGPEQSRCDKQDHARQRGRDYHIT